MPPNPGPRLAPSEVDCKWWMRGYCARGNTCYFKHDDAMFEAQKGLSRVRVQETPEVSTTVPPSAAEEDGVSTPTSDSPQSCAICYEIPSTYGLLVNCDHVFCLECIRSWRSTAPTNPLSQNELKKTSKTCPMCRERSFFIIPSPVWPEGSTMKKEIVDGYLGRLKTIPCRYFKESGDDTAPDYKFKCPFGNSCHYSHTHPITKEPYTFSKEELKPQRRIRRRGGGQFLEDMAMMEILFGDLAVGYHSGDDWADTAEEEDDDFGVDQFVFQAADFLGNPGQEFDLSGISDDDDVGYDLEWD